MGIGGGPREWDDYEWFRLADVPDTTDSPTDPLAAALLAWLVRNPLWSATDARRVLLVDLDNLRADPRRWRARMAAVVALARLADQVAMAGQVAAVRRARPHLAEFASTARPVANGSDVADQALLDSVADLGSEPVQVIVVSNDGIFASLADIGPLLVVSPGREALSDRLDKAADRVVDLVALEVAAEPPAPPTRRRRAGSAHRVSADPRQSA